jgi:hypothetical protein
MSVTTLIDGNATRIDDGREDEESVLGGKG